MTSTWPWIILILLGAYHGLNPAMGWLFALSLGLQEKRRVAVTAALLPIAAGHAAAIAIVILLLRLIQPFLALGALKWIVAGILFVLGVHRIFRASHPRGAGMRVGGTDLFVWSFLMASAHGAGLMLIPVLLAKPMHGMSHEAVAMVPLSLNGWLVISAVLVHTISMLVVAGALALVFFETYDKVGLRILRVGWLNFDVLWAFALVVAACAALLA